MAIITVSRQLGSGGGYIAREVAKRLNFQYVNKEVISEAAKDYGVSERELTRVDEGKPTFWQRFDEDRRRYLTYLKAAVYEFAQKDNVVIVGRGGEVLLKDVTHALKVKVIAPLELRIEMVMKDRKLDRREATKLIHQSDRDRAGYMRYLFDVDWMDSKLYDLVINTGGLFLDLAVDLITRAIKEDRFKSPSKVSIERLADLSLASLVEAALAKESRLRPSSIEVSALKGTVTLSGTAYSLQARGLAEGAAKGVKGVERVVNEIAVPSAGT